MDTFKYLSTAAHTLAVSPSPSPSLLRLKFPTVKVNPVSMCRALATNSPTMSISPNKVRHGPNFVEHIRTIHNKVFASVGHYQFQLHICQALISYFDFTSVKLFRLHICQFQLHICQALISFSRRNEITWTESVDNNDNLSKTRTLNNRVLLLSSNTMCRTRSRVKSLWCSLLIVRCP